MIEGLKHLHLIHLVITSREFRDVEIVDVYQEVRWFFPKMKQGQMLAVILNNKEKPKCAYL